MGGGGGGERGEQDPPHPTTLASQLTKPLSNEYIIIVIFLGTSFVVDLLKLVYPYMVHNVHIDCSN